MAAEDVGAAAALADIAQRELQQTGSAHDRVADAVLGLTHAPDDGAGTVLGHGLGNLVTGRFIDTAGLFDLVWRPFAQALFAHLVHAVDVVHHTEQERDVGPRADANVVVGFRCGAREARVDHDHLAAVFLGVQHVQHRHRMRFGRIAADVHRSFRVLHVVVGVGHRAIPPGVGHAGHRGGVADACLVVGVVAAPEAHPLAQQVGLLVVVLARAHDKDRIRAALLA